MILQRKDFLPIGIFGSLLKDDGTLICVTLEHSYQQSDGTYQPKVPIGQYTCVRGVHSLRLLPEFETFEITGVSGHTGILFHVGNYNADSEGCVLLGTDDVGDHIEHSAFAFKNFMDLMDGINSFELVLR